MKKHILLAVGLGFSALWNYDRVYELKMKSLHAAGND